MEKNMNDLVTEYETDASYIAKLQSELVQAQERARNTLELLMSSYGPGPYNVNGKSLVVLRRKGTMCTMPAVRTRKNKRNTNNDSSVVVSSDNDVDNNTDTELDCNVGADNNNDSDVNDSLVSDDMDTNVDVDSQVA